jgi:hypothetical protein
MVTVKLSGVAGDVAPLFRLHDAVRHEITSILQKCGNPHFYQMSPFRRCMLCHSSNCSG